MATMVDASLLPKNRVYRTEASSIYGLPRSSKARQETNKISADNSAKVASTLYGYFDCAIVFY
jgi:hypothetical protein